MDRGGAPRLVTAEPMLFVTDMARAVAWYTGRLGFRVVFLHGEPAFYGQVERDGARLNLRHADLPAIGPEFRAMTEDALSAALTVEEVEELFLEFRTAGAAFHQLLREEPWGAWTFILEDPDGNLLHFAGSVGSDDALSRPADAVSAPSAPARAAPAPRGT
jgi:catechol 2,3-dioxygenase-like lactoylglutathione lyase family enzyme